jgi:hypothetical protein
MKRIVAILLCLTMCMSLVLPVFAQGVSPYWIGVTSESCYLTFVGTTGLVDTYIEGNSSVTAITGTLKLYWGIIKLDEWTINVQDNEWSVWETFEGKSGRNYKLKLNAKVCSGGVWETITDECTAECP